MRTRNLLLLLAALLLYIIVGGVVFRALEQGNEVVSRVNTTALVTRFLDEHQCVSRKELEDFIQFALEKYKEGVAATDNSTQGNTWSLHNAVFFSVTVVTTIGYGNISPSTPGGQIFCIFFAIFGIPLCLIFLGEIGRKISQATHTAATRINCLQYRIKTTRFIEGCVFIMTGGGLFILVPAIVFSQLEEDWTYGDSIYYGVVTLTTIGFGDYVAGQNAEKRQQWYRLCIAAWILIGLAWMATVLAFVQDSYAKLAEKDCKETKEQNGLPKGLAPSSEQLVKDFLARHSTISTDDPNDLPSQDIYKYNDDSLIERSTHM